MTHDLPVFSINVFTVGSKFSNILSNDNMSSSGLIVSMQQPIRIFCAKKLSASSRASLLEHLQNNVKKNIGIQLDMMKVLLWSGGSSVYVASAFRFFLAN